MRFSAAGIISMIFSIYLDLCDQHRLDYRQKFIAFVFNLIYRSS